MSPPAADVDLAVLPAEEQGKVQSKGQSAVVEDLSLRPAEKQARVQNKVEPKAVEGLSVRRAGEELKVLSKEQPVVHNNLAVQPVGEELKETNEKQPAANADLVVPPVEQHSKIPANELSAAVDSLTDEQLKVSTKEHNANRLVGPLKSSGSLDSYEHFDVTPVIGEEFSKLQLSEILSDNNKIRDLAILS